MRAAAAERRREWDALAEAIVKREERLGFFRRHRDPTPLEGLRIALRRRRRRTLQKSLQVAVSPSRIRYYWQNRVPAGAQVRVAAAAIITVAILQVLTPSLTDAAVRAAVSLVVPNAAVARIEQALRCAQVHSVLDGGGVLVGVVPKHRCGSRPFVSERISEEGARPMYLAWKATEGEYHSSTSTISGLSLKGWGRAAVQFLGRLTGVFDGTQTGGSNPIEVAVDNLLGRPYQLSLGQKIRAGFDTITFTADRLGSESERDRFVSENIPCVRGTAGTRPPFGYPIAGNLCARFLFGKAAAQLNWAERCLWAASANLLFRVVGPGTADNALRAARQAEADIRERAVSRCLDKLKQRLSWTETKYEVLVSQTRTMYLPISVEESSSSNTIISLDLHRTMPGLAMPFRDELKLLERRVEREPIQLNVSASTQQKAYKKVMNVLARSESRLGARLCILNCDSGDETADFVAMLAQVEDNQLHMRLTIANKHFLVTGPFAEHMGVYQKTPTDRPVGSTNKAWLVPYLIEAGYTSLCNEVPVGFRGRTKGANADLPCDRGEGMINLRLATARSANAAFADGASRLGRELLEREFDRLGFHFDRQLKDLAFLDGLVLGNKVTAAPMTLSRNLAALFLGSRGESAESSLPRIIVSQQPLDVLNWLAPETVLTRQSLISSAEILSAPIEHREGTLHELASILEHYNCKGAIGKSGTSDSAIPGAVRDKIAIAAFQCGQQSYVAYAMIGSPSFDRGLGAIATSDLVALIDALLSAQLKPTI